MRARLIRNDLRGCIKVTSNLFGAQVPAARTEKISHLPLGTRRIDRTKCPDVSRPNQEEGLPAEIRLRECAFFGPDNRAGSDLVPVEPALLHLQNVLHLV